MGGGQHSGLNFWFCRADIKCAQPFTTYNGAPERKLPSAQPLGCWSAIGTALTVASRTADIGSAMAVQVLLAGRT